MIDSILIGMSGLDSFSEGLRVVSNNATNLNTPGFKGSSTQFGDLFFADDGVQAGRPHDIGYGVGTLGTTLNFKQGQLQSDGKPLDLGISGDGLFMLRDADGKLHYTRAGQFHFDNDGILVDATGQQKVVSVDAQGAQGVFSMEGLRTNPPQATAHVVFQGNLDNTQTGSSGKPNPATIAMQVLDPSGQSHALTLTLTPDAVVPNEWNLEVDDGTKKIATGGPLRFIGGHADPSTAKIPITYTPVGSDKFTFMLDFSGPDVTSDAGLGSLKVGSSDGRASGALTGTTFDETGTLVYSYSNGQTVKGSRLQLASFASTDAVTSVGSNEFDAKDARQWRTGTAGDDGFGTIQSGVVELSNVDLSQEFSDLVIMQRGYQASSRIVSTANDLIQELFDMKGHR